MSNQLLSLSKWFKRFYLICFLALSIGIPLIFSSITRSVFEVNKLLFLRLIILLLCGAWLLKSCILKDNGFEHSDDCSYHLFGFKWRRIGLEIPVLFWIITNIISIIVSQNIFISLVGAYDRWEGLMTILNYVVLFYMTAKLIDNTKYRILIFCLCLFSTSISSFYGLVQSLGLDFMNWSADPTKRVFACINNPVHFCAYVGMIVPIGLSLSHYFLNKLTSISSFITKSYMPILYIGSCVIYSILSLIILHFLRIPISLISHSQFLSLFALMGVILYQYSTILPSRKTIGYIISYLFFIFFLFIVNSVYLNVFQICLLVLGLSLCYCIRAIGNKDFLIYRLCNICTLLSFYAMLLSFSRATIIGYVICISFFYQLILQNKIAPITLSRLIMLFFGVCFTHILLIFKVHLFGTGPSIIAIVMGIISFLLIYVSSMGTFFLKQKSIKNLGCSFSLFLCLTIPFLSLPIITSNLIPITCILILVFLFLHPHVNQAFIKNCLCLFLVLNLLFYFTTISYIILFFVLLMLLYIFVLKPSFSAFDQFHIIITFALKAGLVFIPLFQIITHSFHDLFYDLSSFPDLLNYSLLFFIMGFLYFLAKRSFSRVVIIISIFFFIGGIFMIQFKSFNQPYFTHTPSKSDSLLVAKTIEGRMTNLSSNRARLYMWLSVPAWVLDNPLFGSGPDTIRHLYPVYRHPQYGIHEGGHNFTPDRLHNEYLNTLATNGIIGFIVKYIFLFGGWYLIMLKLYLKHTFSKNQVILSGIIVAPGIYLVQTLFNFGVVATLFLFYFLLGIGLSFINDEYTDYEHA